MLIFFDIDGTLIGEQSHVMLESTKEAVQRARSLGHICMINTGRSGKLVGADVTGLTEFDGLAMGCGTMIVYRGETLFHRTFSEKESHRIVAGLRRHGIDACLEGSEENYWDSDERIFTASFREFKHRFDGMGYGTFEEAPGHFDKFYAYADKVEKMDAFRQEFAGMLDFVDRLGGYYEIMPAGYSKASAIRYMARHLGIPMSETVAVGDSSNDIPMLTCAGVSIAMGNAAKDVKAVADYVTTDVDEDGIRNALRWLEEREGRR